MRNLHHGGVVAVILLGTHLALACSCANSTPIQKTSEKYAERAVFTARVVSLFGTIYNFDGKRSSSLALAVVKERHWGLPRSWPNVVLLDGSYPCDIALKEGEDYLVSGWRSRYGVVSVNGCSRTQPLKTAQVDLRTLDGTHCAGPGGTIIGRLWGSSESSNERIPLPNTRLAFSSVDGKENWATTDAEGIYEIRHLPPGRYRLHSQLTNESYAISSEAIVAPDFCAGMDIQVAPYTLLGRLMPGTDRYVKVSLIGLKPKSERILADSVEPDGRFYFGKVPPGRYLLSVRFHIGNTPNEIYYPGTRDKAQADQFEGGNSTVARSFDFDPKSLPLVQIPVVLQSSSVSNRYYWRVRLAEYGGPIVAERDWHEVNPVILYGIPGMNYKIFLWGYANDPADNDCASEGPTLTTTRAIDPIQIALPSSCR